MRSRWHLHMHLPLPSSLLNCLTTDDYGGWSAMPGHALVIRWPLDGVPAGTPVLLLDSDQSSERIDVRRPGLGVAVTSYRTLLAQLVAEAHLTRDDAIAKFDQVARDLGERVSVSPRQFSRWMSGESGGPRPAACRVLEHLFQRPVAELVAPPGVLPPIQNHVIEHLATGLPHVGESATPGGRRSRGTLVGDELTAVIRDEKEMIELAAYRARTFALSSGESGLGGVAMEQLHADVSDLARAYPRLPLSEILGGLVSMQDTLFTLLEGRQKPRHIRELYFLASITAGMLAKASHDLSDPHAAMTQARTALVCADQSDHAGLRAWVRGLQSLVAYWAGRPRDSIRYAQSGDTHAAASQSTTSVWLPLSEARAWAALGNAAAVRAAVENAESARELVQPDELDNIGGICTFGSARQLYYAADALTWLPAEAVKAAQYSAQAIEAYRDADGLEWAFGDQAGSYADLAISRIAQGEIEGAGDALAPVLELVPEQKINGIVASVQRVHHALRNSEPGRVQRELQEAIEVFCRSPLAALPR